MTVDSLRHYHAFVHALMQRGWYRAGVDRPGDGRAAQWRFRRGHLLDDEPEAERTIVARSELIAMRRLLAQLQAEEPPPPR